MVWCHHWYWLHVFKKKISLYGICITVNNHRHPFGLFFILSIQSRRRTALSDRSATSSLTASKVNHLYGVKAWKCWVQQRDKQQPQSESAFYFLSLLGFSFSNSLTAHNYYGLVHPVDIKEDILECNSVELSFALARFIQEVRRPNGEMYSPDSIFYLCLGIQQVPTLIYIRKLAIFLWLCVDYSPALSGFNWTVPVYARPDREHLHRSTLQPVHCWDYTDAASLEA